MGFTRYFYIQGQLLSNHGNFKDFSNLAKELCDNIQRDFNISIAGPFGKDNPIFSENEIAFNGVSDDSHETFYLANPKTEKEEFNFCKTNRKPYDIHVYSVLILASKFFGEEKIRVSSDGSENDPNILDYVKKFLRDKKIDILVNI